MHDQTLYPNQVSQDLSQPNTLLEWTSSELKTYSRLTNFSSNSTTHSNFPFFTMKINHDFYEPCRWTCQHSSHRHFFPIRLLQTQSSSNFNYSPRSLRLSTQPFHEFLVNLFQTYDDPRTSHSHRFPFIKQTGYHNAFIYFLRILWMNHQTPCTT